MARRITPDQIRQRNRSLIYHYLYQHKEARISQQELSYELRLSRPTVAGILSDMEQEGLVCQSGQIASNQVGRKAVGYSIVPDYRCAVGVEILRREIKLALVDLYGQRKKWSVVPLAFDNTPANYHAVGAHIRSFLLEIPEETILGVGIAMPGLTSPDGDRMVYGQILDCTGLTIDALANELPFPCRFYHDAESAAYAELWADTSLANGFYLSLSRHLGAAMIVNREILTGLHGHCATIEHIRVSHGNRPCYCGKHGCLETECSINALLQQGETLDGFFSKVRTGEEEAKKRWARFLHVLAEALANLHLMYDTDFILGGYLSAYLTQADFDILYGIIQSLTPFPEEKDFLHMSAMPEHGITVGAALPYITKFLTQLRA